MKSKNPKLSAALKQVITAMEAALLSAGDGPLFDELQRVDSVVREVTDHLNGREMEGRCRMCGCTHETPCEMDGEVCSWYNDAETLCSNPVCVASARAGSERR